MSSKAKQNEQIIHGFNELRGEQRQLANKVVELEADLTEHKLVLEALAEVDGSRKCFRMIGGVLVERTVGDVLPPLQTNKDNIQKIIETLKAQIVTKGKEITDYMDKHNIQIRQESGLQSTAPEGGAGDKGSESASNSMSVLVE